MLQLLPNELLWLVLNNLEYSEVKKLSNIKPITSKIQQYIQQQYPFQYKITSLLSLFEAITTSERQLHETRLEFANQILQLICKSVEPYPKFDHRTHFTELLDILQQFILDRILIPDLKTGLEVDYVNLCLEIRSLYLHTPSIRVLHDPKYRRRSTKHPLAPFLPRDYAFVWRKHCQEQERISRDIHTRFAIFFGSLFDITSLYLESNLDGSFEECAREALVTGNVQDLLIMCVSADRPIDIEGMCMMVTHAGEQLRLYLETMETWVTNDPTPQQVLRMQQEQDLVLVDDENPSNNPPPEWLIPDRYKVHPDTILRLKLMYNLYKKGWRWFQ